jgi:hypothetical protein
MEDFEMEKQERKIIRAQGKDGAVIYRFQYFYGRTVAGLVFTPAGKKAKGEVEA